MERKKRVEEKNIRPSILDTNEPPFITPLKTDSMDCKKCRWNLQCGHDENIFCKFYEQCKFPALNKSQMNDIEHLRQTLYRLEILVITKENDNIRLRKALAHLLQESDGVASQDVIQEAKDLLTARPGYGKGG